MHQQWPACHISPHLPITRSPVASPPHYQWPAWLPYLSAGHNIGTLGENATTGFRTFDISRISTCTNSCTSVSNAITDTKEGKSLDMYHLPHSPAPTCKSRIAISIQSLLAFHWQRDCASPLPGFHLMRISLLIMSSV